MGRATDFSNCYIYHILDKEKVVHYVGSTSNFNSRKSCHRFRCNTEHDKQHNLDIYRYIRDNGGFDAFEIVPIQKIENISNKTELRIAERAEMEKFSGLKNMRGSYLSTEEYQEKQRLWRENNPEKHAENCRKWAKNNPEKIKEKNRKYVEENSEKIKEYKRQYYQKKKQLKNNDQ
jgi:hypothetical protein